MITNGHDAHVRTWIEIDTDAIRHNYSEFRRNTPEHVQITAVVKSNAYGHDLVPFTRAIVAAGADSVAVDSIAEALTLRSEGVTAPILVLGHTQSENYAQAAERDITLTISNSDALDALSDVQASHVLSVHIKVDTGMHRQGFLHAQIPEVLKKLSALEKGVRVDGLYTHFAAAKNPAFPEYTQAQIRIFTEWKIAFENAGLSVLAHAAATSGAILFPEAHFDAVRIGIGMYGLWPSKEVEEYAKDRFTLRPVLSWKTIVGEIKILPAGAATGYDGTETVDEDTRVAVLPVGYWHGYVRALSSIGHVLLHGKKARVLGRVSMDMIVVDISALSEVAVGDEVVLLGVQGGEEISATQMGDLSDTVNYEVITRLNPRILRAYVHN